MSASCAAHQRQPITYFVSYLESQPFSMLTHLMAWVDHGVSNNYVLPSPCNKDNNLGDVIGGQGFAATVIKN
jgi:hypothetical protein